MRVKLILLFVGAILSFVKGWAYDQSLEMPEVTVPSGALAYLQIDLADDEHTVGIQADIEIPDGFSVLPQEEDPNHTQYILNTTRNSKLMFQASYPYKDSKDCAESYHNDIRLVIMSNDNSYIKGKAGWIAKIPMVNTVEPGTYEAKMHKIHLSTKWFDEATNKNAYTEIDLPDVTVNIIVTEPEEIRYTDNQLFCNDIEITQGENADLTLSYNSTSDVYEFSADVVFPTNVVLNGEVIFSETLTSIDNYSTESIWDDSKATLSLSGAYGGRRNDPSPSGVQKIATVKLKTSSLAPGEYEIKVNNQMLSNDDDDYEPAEYIGKLVVKASVITPSEKCATPTISVVNNHLYVHSDTEGATYHTSIVASDHKDVVHGEDEPIELGGQYLVTSYASADGLADSEPATATLIWNKSENNVSSSDGIEMEVDRMLLLRSVGDNIEISGIAERETIGLYDLAGVMLYQGNVDGDSFVIPYQCSRGQIYIVKVNSSTFKYLF